MDAGASTGFGYAHGSQNYQPHISPLWPDPLRSARSRCPAIGNWAAARQDWSDHHRPWNPHHHVSAGFIPETQPPYASPQRWPPHGSSDRTGEPPSSRPTESSHQQDTGPHAPLTMANAYHPPFSPASGPGSVPPHVARPEGPPSPPSPPSSHPTPPHRVAQPPPAQQGQALPAGAPSNGSSLSPPVAPSPQSSGETPGWGRVLDSPTQTFVRVRLPAPSDPRTGQRLSAHHPQSRAAAHGGLLGGSARTGDNNTANVAASPSPSLDDDSDTGGSISRTMTMMNHLHSNRQSQILRGQMSNKRVASKKAIQSLKEVDLDKLPDNEKTCVICYNDFGVASPEGTVEIPLQLPKCKHVFGNKCILKWLEDSFSCPYCRDKLDSELARPSETMIRRMVEAARGDPDLLGQTTTLRRLLAMTHHHAAGPGSASERAFAAWRRQRDYEAANRESITRGERRGVPFPDASEAERRIRPRHEGFHPSRSAVFESPHTTGGNTLSPSSSTASPQSPGAQSPSYRPPPVWQEPQPLFMTPQMAHSPSYMLHVPTSGPQQSSAPLGQSSTFAPLPPPVAMSTSGNLMPPFMHQFSSTHNYQVPSLLPNGDYYGGPYMHGYSGLGSAAAPGPESTYVPMHMPPTSSQLPGFPDFINQLPHEITFQPESYTASRPPPN